MRNSTSIRLAMVVLTVWALAALPAWAASNKYRIQVSEGAKSDGEIVFAFSPEGVAAFEVAVPIAKGTSENAVARKIRDVLRAEARSQGVLGRSRRRRGRAGEEGGMASPTSDSSW